MGGSETEESSGGRGEDSVEEESVIEGGGGQQGSEGVDVGKRAVREIDAVAAIGVEREGIEEVSAVQVEIYRLEVDEPTMHL